MSTVTAGASPEKLAVAVASRSPPEPSKITWALQEVSSVVVVDDADTSESRQQRRRGSEAPPVDVRELARRRGSDPFSGYNVADIYDDPEVSSMAKSVAGSVGKDEFDPKTFQVYAPAMDVDALCSELLNLAGDMLANPNTIMSASTSPTDEATDDAEELARQRLRRLRSNGNMGKINSFGRPGVRGGPQHYQLHSSASGAGLSHNTPLSPTNDPLNQQGGNAEGPRRGNALQSSTVSPLSPTNSGSQRATPRFGSGSVYSDLVERAATGGMTPRSAAASNVQHLQQTIKRHIHQTNQADAHAMRKMRLQMMLDGLRNGDFNAEFIQSIQQLQDPEDAVKAIGAYYEQGKDLTHHKAMAARRGQLNKVERKGTFRFAAGVPRPGSSDGGHRRSTFRPSVTLSDPASGTPRAGTPPSGDHERRRVLMRVLEQRRESEIQRINDKQDDLHSGPGQLQRQRSLGRAQSLANISLKSFVRRRSSWMRANGTISSSVGSLSTRWRRRAQVGSSQSPELASLPSGVPDVFMLFFESEKGPLTIQDITSSTARFLGTISYIYLFPPPQSDTAKQLATSSKTPRTPRMAIAAAPLPPSMDDSLKSQMEPPSSLTIDAVAALYGALLLEASQAAEEDIADGKGGNESEVVPKAEAKARDLLFPLLHRRLCRQLQENTLNDLGKGTSGIMFFSSVSKFVSTIETCETNQGTRFRLSKGPIVGNSSMGGASPLGGVSLQALMSGSAAAIAFEMSGKGTYADFLQYQQSMLQSPTAERGGPVVSLIAPDGTGIDGWNTAAPGTKPSGGVAGAKRNVLGDGGAMEDSLTASDSPHSQGPRRYGDKSGEIVLSAGSMRGSSPSSQPISVDGIMGVNEHVRRVAQSRLSVLQYPQPAPREYHHADGKQPSHIPSPPSRDKRLSTKPAAQQKPEPLAPWLLHLQERDEEFPPRGLDVAPGVREHHIPRLFESIVPRPPAPNVRAFTPRKQASGRGDMSPRLTMSPSAATWTSPSGRVVHRVQPIPHKLLHATSAPTIDHAATGALDGSTSPQWLVRSCTTPASSSQGAGGGHTSRFPHLIAVPSPHHPTTGVTSRSSAVGMDKWSVASEGGAIGIPGGNNSHREQHLIDKERGIVGSTLTPFMNTLLPHGPSPTEEVGLPLIAIPVPQMSLLTSHHAPPGTSDVHTIQSRRLMPSRQGERNDQRHKQPPQSPRMRTQ